ncbi:MAG: hypothetical protein ACFFBH_10735 [Promethearchaeota archaeon]
MESPLRCDICDSENVTKSESGYVCKDCGVMLDLQILEYHRPYNQDIVQYAPIGKTQIGSIKERLKDPRSYKLHRLSKLDNLKSNDETVNTQAMIEMNRIFEVMSLPESDKKKVFNNFVDIRSKLGRGTKYRTPEKLIPLVIYFTCKYECKPIDEHALLEVSHINKRDFQSFKLQIHEFKPEYKERNRKEYIAQKILEITECFELGMYFYYQSKKILDMLWEVIKNTKDTVITGVVTSVSALCVPSASITVSEICKRLNIRMSTIHKQVERKIFEQFRIPGFISLVKSAGLLKEVMQKLGALMEECMEECDIVPERDKIIEVKLGSGTQVFNAFDTMEYYFLAIRDLENNPILLSLAVDRLAIHNLVNEHNHSPKLVLNPQIEQNELFNLAIWRVKGPPLITS